MAPTMRGELTTTEVATMLGLKVTTVQHLIEAGTLRGRKVGRQWMVMPEDVETYRQTRLGRKGWTIRKRQGIGKGEQEQCQK